MSERANVGEQAGSMRQSAGERDLETLRRLAVELAKTASQIHVERLKSEKRIETKSSGTDFVSDVDRSAESTIVGALMEARPHDAILSEEGTLQDGSSGVRWVIDPLDGTSNYLHGYPAFATSIGVEVDGRPAVGAVCESLTGAVYSAVAGQEAHRDDQRISVTGADDLSQALLSTGFSYSAAHREREAHILTRVVGQVADVRRSGSASLDLCWVAAGRLDAYFELDLKPWDYAAAGVIVRAAGGEMLTVDADHGYGPAIVATNPALMPALLDLLEQAGAIRR